MKKTDKSTLPDRALFHADSLELLERIPSAQVQFVYLDPPFYVDSQFDTKRNNLSDYLKFLSHSFVQSRRVLSDSGNLVLHFEPYYLPYVRLILDEVFGQDNFKTEFVIPLNRISNPEAPTFEVIIVYQKSKESVYNQLYTPYSEHEIRRFFPYKDKKGYYRLFNLVTPGRYPKNIFEWRGIQPPKGYSWRYSIEKMDQLFQNNQISFNLSKKIPSLKEYANQTKGIPLTSILNQVILEPDENTGYASQQPLQLLNLLIRVFSNEGEYVLDPFCGSGTSLIAAELLGRRWIGCDDSKEAMKLSLSRLRHDLQLSRTKIFFGNKESIKEIFDEVHQLPEVEVIPAIERPLRLDLQAKPQSRTNQVVLATPRIITEGKTDWKHMKAAYLRLKDAGFIAFEVSFDEFEEARGDADTLDMCRKYARNEHPQTQIFLFDRDVPNIVKAVSGETTIYRDWGNNVYSFPLPLAQHRLETPDISIEFYYQDADLIRKDKQNRRLFLNNEFYPNSGRHKQEDINCLDLGRLRSNTLKIIDERVFNNRNENIALTKDAFANYIYEDDSNFSSLDIYAFAKIFEVIAEIMKYPDGAISIPVPTKTKRREKAT